MPAETESRIRSVAVIPVVELPDAGTAVPMMNALYEGGLRSVEITLRTPSAVAGIRAIRKAFPDVFIGAGTVLDADQVPEVTEAGADFAVSPAISEEVVNACATAGLPILPGACTPRDIEVGRRLKLTLLKFFPAEALGGARTLRALCGPYRNISFVPTGGLTLATLGDYFAIPQVAACGGSWTVTPELLAGRRWDEIRRLATTTVEMARASGREVSG